MAGGNRIMSGCAIEISLTWPTNHAIFFVQPAGLCFLSVSFISELWLENFYLFFKYLFIHWTCIFHWNGWFILKTSKQIHVIHVMVWKQIGFNTEFCVSPVQGSSLTPGLFFKMHLNFFWLIQSPTDASLQQQFTTRPGTICFKQYYLKDFMNLRRTITTKCHTTTIFLHQWADITLTDNEPNPYDT